MIGTKFHWSSEIYGLGAAYRSAFKIPRFLPLPFYSDHGVIASGVIDENILRFPIWKKTFLTFSESIAEARDIYPSLRILGQIHPWVVYKEKHSIKKSYNPEIVIFFPLHTVNGYQVSGMEDEKSISYLKSLNEKTGIIKVCLHSNDLGTEREKLFKSEGFDVISFGDPMGDEFIQNFYNFARVTKYAISESWTSGVAFLIDLDVPCVILRRDLRVESHSNLNRKVGFDNPQIRADIQYAEQLFSELTDIVTDEQRSYIQNQLGYPYRSNHSRNLRVVLILYVTSWPSWWIYKIGMKIKGLIKNRYSEYT
jgi:hypothetical protein